MKKGIIKTMAAVLLTAMMAMAQIWDGSVAASDWWNPWDDEIEVSNGSQLARIAQLVNDGTNMFPGKTIKLTANIQLNNTDDWEDWSASVQPSTGHIWTMIGNNSSYPATLFQGVFDGNGYVISGLYSSTGGSLFRIIHDNAVVKNLGVVASFGNLAETNNGTITNCYAVGKTERGGLVISNSGRISNSYSASVVTGSGGAVGGLAGSNNASVFNSFYDTEVSTKSDMDKGVPKSTLFMQGEKIVELLNMAADGIERNVWVHNPSGYPTLSQTKQNKSVADLFGGGNGATVATSYLIKEAKHLEALSILSNTNNFANMFFMLESDIELNNTSNWENWETTPPENIWEPILDFRGTFDGNGYVISGVYINTSSNAPQGLFGSIDGGTAVIKNLGLIESYIKNSNLGAYSGGIVGVIGMQASNSTVQNCYSSVTVFDAGIGRNYGIVGNNYGKINNCHSFGKSNGVAENSTYSGLYETIRGTTTASYYDMEVSETNDATRGEPKPTAFMKGALFLNLLNLSASNLSPTMNAWASSDEYPVLSKTAVGEIDISDFFGGASGDANDPYLIANAEQLELFAMLVNMGNDFLSKTIKLTANIALNTTKGTPNTKEDWTRWEWLAPDNVWTAIGTENNRFKGIFDGNGHIVSGVYISNTSNNQGLFGYIEEATIKNVGIVESYIKGGNSIGGLVGISHNATISNSYSAAAVSGTGTYVGGLLGGESGSSMTGMIVNCHSTAKLAGWTRPQTQIRTSYGYLASNRQDVLDFLNIVAIENSLAQWVMGAGGYPTFSENNDKTIADYFGTEGYSVGTVHQLKMIQVLTNSGKTFAGETVKLTDDIDLEDEEWTPIGNDVTTKFKGTFDGAGKVVSGLYINTTENYQGLFGNTEGATIKNLGVKGSVTAEYNVGGLVAIATLTDIDNCYFEGDVSGNGGGLVGTLAGGTINNSHSKGSVSGGTVGGLVGSGTQGPAPEYRNNTITNSYSTANVTATGTAGGLISGVESSVVIINNCYATGDVSGGSRAGGLVGSKHFYSDTPNGIISNSFSTGKVTIGSGTRAGGLVGGDSDGMTSDLVAYGIVVNSYYDTQTSMQSDVLNKGEPRATAFMQSEALVGFLNIAASKEGMNAWQYNENGYPTLTKQSRPFDINDYIPDNTISNAVELELFGFLVNNGETFEDETVQLVGNIVLDNPDFMSIGYSPNEFNGTFEGNGHTVSNAIVIRPSVGTNYLTSSWGFFGNLGEKGTIKNFGLVNADVKGVQTVGGLAAINMGEIVNSYFTGKVDGGNFGGVGGLVGSNGGTIRNSWVSATVTAESGTINAFVGSTIFSAIIANNYYDSDVSGSVSDTRATAKSTTAMKNTAFVELLNAAAGVWEENEWTHQTAEYPKLTATKASSDVGAIFGNGLGKEESPYLIGTANQLDIFNFYMSIGMDFEDKFIKLTSDITASAGEWTPLGTQSNPFKGTFDGDGHIVKSIQINRAVADNSGGNVGFFGYINENATIKNLGIAESTIKGWSNVGGLVGYNDGGTITNCHSSATVEGANYYAGGLIGVNYGNVSFSHSTGVVTGNVDVGGLIGYNYDGKVSNSYSSGEVSGKNNAGGLIGSAVSSEVINCYSTASVDGDDYSAGGLIARISDGTYSYNYASGPVTAGLYTGGLIGYSQGSSPNVSHSFYDRNATGQEPNAYDFGTPKTTAEMKQMATFAGWDFDGGAWAIKDGDSYPILQRVLIPATNYTYNKAAQLLPTPLSYVSNNGKTTVLAAADYDIAYLTSNINAGMVKVGIKGKGDYAFIDMTREYQIKPLYIDVIWEGEVFTFTYDGEEKTITAISEDEDNFPIKVENGKQTNWGGYIATASLATPDEGNVILNNPTQNFTINKRNVEVEWTGTATHIYDGTEKAINATSKDAAFPIEVSNNTRTNHGTSTATASLADNHGDNVVLQNPTKDLTINKRNVNVLWQGDVFEFVYDGTAKTITATSSEDTYPITLSGNVQTNANDNAYNAVASLATPNDNISLQNATQPFKINRAEGEGGVMIDGWRFGSNTNDPVPFSETNGIAGVTYTYEGSGYPKNAAKPSNPGSYVIEATFPQAANYNSFTATNNFVINNADATPIEVVWTEQTEFIYNKMVQVPIPSVSGNQEIELIVLNGQAAVGEYKGPLSALAMIKNESQRRLYDLQNNTMEYSIARKPLRPRFMQKEVEGFADTAFEATEDTVYVVPEIYENDELLAELLHSLAGYTGFAIDTVSKEADNAAVLTGELEISLVSPVAARYAGNNFLAKNLSGDSKQARIDASKISGRNYSMSTAIKNVVIVEATNISPTAATDPIDYPADNPVTPVAPQKQYVAGSVKFWQSSGMLHLDLGSSFANAGNVVLEVRDLKGRFVLRQDINEQVSSVRLESGVFAITIRGAGISKNAVVMVR